LAGELMASWQRDDLPHSPRRAIILSATANHDNGWREEDAAPIVDQAGRRIVDFMTAPDHLRQRVWPRGVASLDGEPYAAALVAEHAITVYDHYRALPGWTPFFSRMEDLRDRLLQRAAPLKLADLHTDYFFVRMGDLLSLTFCCRWPQPREYRGYEVRWTGSRLVVKPDPFDGQHLHMSIPARRIPRTALNASGGPAAIEQAYRAAEPVQLPLLAAGDA
jgi:hypothetical protein